MIMLVILHFIVMLLPKVELKEKSGWWTKIFHFWVKKLNEFFKFTVYIRLILESYQFLMLSSLSNFREYDYSNTSKIVSLFFSGVIILLCIFILFISYYMYHSNYDTNYSPKRQNWEEIINGVKSENKPRLANFFSLLRRTSLIVWLVFGPFGAQVMIIGWCIINFPHMWYIIIIRPYEKIYCNIIEIINELFLLIITSFLWYFYLEKRWNNLVTQIYMFIIFVNTATVTLILLGKVTLYML